MYGEFDRPNPSQYLGRGVKGAEKTRPLDFSEKYRAKPPSAPFRSDRFDALDLMSRVQNRKVSLNKRLGFFPEPVFPELGRFNRAAYNFATGVSDTVESPVDQPGFDPEFPELYAFSPVVPPEKKINNPMPTATNPDPKGFLAMMGRARLESLLDSPPSTDEAAKQQEQKQKEQDQQKEDNTKQEPPKPGP